MSGRAPGGEAAKRRSEGEGPLASPPPGEEFETRIGHRFGDPLLLLQALTHRSYSQETDSPAPDNQRLEFLGDAVLQLVVTERLWSELGEADEGELTRRRSERVSGRTLAKVARRLGLPEFLRLGRGEEKTGGREKDSILADAFEALVGAVFLDAGYAGCAGRVASWLWDESAVPVSADYKSRLQEAIQRRGIHLPDYRLVRERGPEHEKTFEVEVRYDGRILGQGSGTSKKAAEQAAARESLAALEAGQAGEAG